MTTWHPVTRALVAVAALAIPASYLLPGGGPAPVAVVEAATRDLGGAPAMPPADLGPATIAPIDQLAETVDRPLFTPTRRPPPVEEVVIEEAVVEVPLPEPVYEPPPVERVPLTAQGVAVASGRSVALLRRQDTGTLVTVEAGDEIGGWLVERIESDRVVLSSPEGDQTLSVFGPVVPQ